MLTGRVNIVRLMEEGGGEIGNGRRREEKGEGRRREGKGGRGKAGGGENTRS
jgi:hypothetical protein